MTDQNDRIAKLEAAYAKVMGVLGVYMTCEQMVKGEAYRDLEATWRHLEGTTPPDADRGWPACFAREAEGRAKAEAELARLRPFAGLYPLAWEECKKWRGLIGEHANNREWGCTDINGVWRWVAQADAHDKARAERGVGQ
jgi:hypothetical protein